MYSTCLFCNHSLGANESIEHFPVGRRLAYDAKTGRLWVVCKKCERWNLSPLESRWEAIEEAERAFRGTKLRVSTDNIGLAQLRDGTELVRIGAPPKTEFAAWRYGDQFGKRQRRFFGTAIVAAGGGKAIATAIVTPSLILSASMPAIAIGGTAAIAFGVYLKQLLKSRRLPHYAIRDQRGVVRRFSVFNAQRASLSPAGHAFEWQLRLPYQQVSPAGRVLRALGIDEVGASAGATVMRDDAAMRALATILPHANLMGGGKSAVRGAVKLVDDAPNLQYLLHTASVASPTMPMLQTQIPRGDVAISALPAPLRLALEMSIHENDERRAMEGELAELETRWKEADAIAKIADEMFLPENVDRTLSTMQHSERKDAPKI